MTNNTKGIIIGGFMPAIMLGLFSIFQKLGAQKGVGPELFIFLGGITIAIVGAILITTMNSGNFNLRSILWGLLSGTCWAIATACVSYAVFNYNTPMSKLSPIFNTNTLTTVILGMLILGEWKELKVIKVFIGAIMIIIGAIVVSGA